MPLAPVGIPPTQNRLTGGTKFGVVDEEGLKVPMPSCHFLDIKLVVSYYSGTVLAPTSWLGIVRSGLLSYLGLGRFNFSRGTFAQLKLPLLWSS